jgi:hypothetical protein
MMDALDSAIQNGCGRFAPKMGETCYAAHIKPPRIED